MVAIHIMTKHHALCLNNIIDMNPHNWHCIINFTVLQMSSLGFTEIISLVILTSCDSMVLMPVRIGADSCDYSILEKRFAGCCWGPYLSVVWLFYLPWILYETPRSYFLLKLTCMSTQKTITIYLVSRKLKPGRGSDFIHNGHKGCVCTSLEVRYHVSCIFDSSLPS